MTQLLQKAFAEIQKLPEAEQNAIAARILDELEDEQKWSSSFESTTDEQWDKLADMARKDIADGDTLSLDNTFPT